ncbi:NAD-P-binding protein [Obba rivulosa]|uniref:NAD-P-binding protein n=1 Tax=Obba rivulosa TaxID=1052685 RepID=A0A8E2B0E8_9APHY|nr:NAD-P-binding protein [Obba rivulosa]
MSLRILSASDVADIAKGFSPDDLVDLMAGVFHSLSSPDIAQKNIVQPHRATIPTANHTVLVMPSSVTGIGTATKIVSVPTAAAPQAVRVRGLPASTLVLDQSSGGVRSIVNARNLTALRNAAGSLLATRLLLFAATVPNTILAVGAGAQIAAHLSLFLASYPSITTCTIFNRSINERLEKLAARLRAKYPAVIFHIGALEASKDRQSLNIQAAVRGANIIITATSSTTPFFPSAWVSPGTHLCLIGSYTSEMHEIDDTLVKRAGRVVVDSREACLHEAGELMSAGCGPSDLVEVGELIAQSANGKWSPDNGLVDDLRSRGDVTIFKSVGVGIQDVAIACAVVDRAEREQIGVVVEDYDSDV